MAAIQLTVDPRWEYHSTSSSHPSQTSALCPEAAYVSLRLPTPDSNNGRDPSDSLVVHRIVFTTESHDQGFSDNEGAIGTYRDSNSFFEAHVSDPSTGALRVPQRRIQYNYHASDVFRTHKNVWDRRDEALAEAGPGAAAWAWYPGWTNVVRFARIEVWAEFVSTRPSLHQPLFGTTDKSQGFYRPLSFDKKEIRLVVVEPDQRGAIEDATLRLSLRYSSLEDLGHVPYDALSYCWGDTAEGEAVLLSDGELGLQDTEIYVRRNLASALRHLRSLDEPAVLWVDLLSINQADPAERGHQVALMGEIFASARSVRVWLGEADDLVTEDLDIIRSVAQRYHERLRTNPELGLPTSREAHEMIAHETFIFVDADSIFIRPWFRRVWVLQEVWNPPSGTKGLQRQVTVHCGQEKLPWEDIAQANRCIYDQLKYLNNYTMPRLLTGLFDITRDREASVLTCVPADRRDILSIVLEGLDLQATDPRDKIFALLIFGHETHHIATLPTLLRPDYTKSAGRVYADFTRWWILQHRSLRILSAVHALEGRQWLRLQAHDGNIPQQRSPSWALWSAGHSSWVRGTLALQDEVCVYRACGDCKTIDEELLTLPAAASRDETDGLAMKLKLRGVRLGSIAAEPAYYPYFQQPPLLAGLQEAGELGQHNLHYNELFRHYMAHWERYPPDPFTSGDSQSDAQSGSESEAQSDSESDVHSGCESDAQTGSDDCSQCDSSDEEPTWLPCHGKCMFTTDDGGRGLCPGTAMAGDVIVILYGGDVPYLLRPSGTPGTYHFIGECYFDGVMSGEAFASDRNLAEEVFVLE
uniref:Heterokaryon incompatibility domain-containing protein n=1 Tax=Bionectria ochroleuca TaxID=29856 RepID=A0A8H7K7H6_BIOOC